LFNLPQTSELFDALYFSTSCGRPYQRDVEWLSFFGAVADQIVRRIHPGTVLDVGCAWGFLVESLRDRSVQAFGVDISPYAIGCAHPNIQPYCRVGSITASFPQRYDLIVCIEVLEHLYPDEAVQAVANLCRYSDDILFSSTPFDREEKTHFNVQTPDYWAGLFAQHGFFHDLDFDATFITPWAMRFRCQGKPLDQTAAAYERHLWQQSQAQQASLESINQLQHELMEAERRVQALGGQLSARDSQQKQLESTAGWVILKQLQYLRSRLAPPDSRRDRILEAILRRWPARNRWA
jgi:hypothetical protein